MCCWRQLADLLMTCACFRSDEFRTSERPSQPGWFLDRHGDAGFNWGHMRRWEMFVKNEPPGSSDAHWNLPLEVIRGTNCKKTPYIWSTCNTRLSIMNASILPGAVFQLNGSGLHEKKMASDHFGIIFIALGGCFLKFFKLLSKKKTSWTTQNRNRN